MDTSVSRWIIWISFLYLVVHSTGIYFLFLQPHLSYMFPCTCIIYVLSYQESKFSAKTGKQNNVMIVFSIVCLIINQITKFRPLASNEQS